MRGRRFCVVRCGCFLVVGLVLIVFLFLLVFSSPLNGLLFNLTRRSLTENRIASSPGRRHDAVVVRVAVVAQHEGRHRFDDVFALFIFILYFVISFCLFVKCFHWLVVVRVYFDWPVVDLAHRLDLDVVAPLAMRALFCNVIVEVAFYEVVEVRALCLDVLHALDAHQPVLVLVAVGLESYRTEEAIAVVADLDDLLVDSHHVGLELFFLGFADGATLGKG